MSTDTVEYLPFLKAFSFSLKQIRLYSVKHPITKQTMIKLQDEMASLFSARDRIQMGAAGRRLIVDGQMIGDKETSINDVAKDFERLGLEGISLHKGIHLEELISLIELLAKRPREIEKKGGFRTLFEKSVFPNVKLTHGKFELVEDGEVVKQIDEGREISGGGESSGGQGGPKSFASMAEIIQRIRGGDQGQSGGEGVLALDAEKIVPEIEKNAKEVASLAVKDAKDAAQLEHSVRKIIKLLIDGLVPFLVKQGKDITKAMDKLAKEIENSVERMKKGEDFDAFRKKVPDIFKEGSDELRVQMMIYSYQQSPKDLKPLQAIARKLFKDGQVRKRLEPEVARELIHVGLSPDAVRDMFLQIEQKEAKKKKRVTVDAEELAELRIKAAQFDVGEVSEGSLEVKKLREENNKIRREKACVDTVIRNLGEGLLVVDAEGKVVLMNPAAERLLNVKQGEKAGRHVREGLSEAHMLAMSSGNLKDFSQSTEKKTEVIALNDDTRKVLQASTAVIENENGQTVGMVSVLSDVTRQKDLEELKEKFVANVSHELRTPLVAIQKSLALIIEEEVGAVNPEQKKFLTIAHRNIDRLSRLINSLLDVSKLEAGKMALRPTKFPVRELLLQTLATMDTWLKDKKIKVETRFSAADLDVEADADRITQIVTNLLGNAVKFTPENGTITVTAEAVIDAEIPGGKAIEVAVCDTGIGIAADDLTKIFDKFVQVGLAQPSGVSSSGLGLTITKEIVELHSGKIWAESELNKGSRFAIRLPVAFNKREKIKA
ncbi:MAG: ATP-binding protein [Candidatus Omnitrophota bacterium]|nr:ATP-binding protein [Candidatus Omnitrophota bacterium]